MELPRMHAVQPITVQPTAGGEYPDWYNTLLLVRPLSNTASLKYKPFNYDTQQILDRDELTVNVEDFLAFVAARPTLAQAVGALTIELGKVAREAELEKAIAAETDQEAIGTLQAQLDAVHAEMGIQ